ncbi:MAG: hypothetical protein GEV04_23050 [Actinophytocola sp.]|nr:hypothetical protein [Actinophytocola sp.]
MTATRVDWRVFRLDRMREVASDRPAFRRDPPADDLAIWLRTDFGRMRIDPESHLKWNRYRSRSSPYGG